MIGNVSISVYNKHFCYTTSLIILLICGIELCKQYMQNMILLFIKKSKTICLKNKTLHVMDARATFDILFCTTPLCNFAHKCLQTIFLQRQEIILCHISHFISEKSSKCIRKRMAKIFLAQHALRIGRIIGVVIVAPIYFSRLQEYMIQPYPYNDPFTQKIISCCFYLVVFDKNRNNVKS